MTTLFCISLVLCTLAGYSSCQQYLDSWRNSVVLVGGICDRDVECIKDAFCFGQQICRCDPNYTQSADNSICLASNGLSCDDITVCQTMTNGECKDGLCACKDDFFLDSRNSSNCIRRPRMIGDFCQTTGVCQESFENAFCINEKCECATGHHFVNQTTSCVKSAKLYNNCHNSYECYDPNLPPDAMECKDGQCECKEGEPCASKGSLITVVGVFLPISLLLQRIA